MSNIEKKEPLVEVWLRSLKNHPAVAALIIIATIVTGIASFTQSVDGLLTYFNVNSDNEKNKEDILLEQSLVGTWKVSSMPPVPTGFEITELNFTILPGGIINWGGSYKGPGYESPIMMSGKWNVQDKVLHWAVESSNVPLMMKEGFSSTSIIKQVTKETMSYRDSVDQKDKIVTRIE